ncbi:MAG: VWA domain-containing protein [Haloplanus sp.]
MGINITATTNVEEVAVDQETTATGTITFDIPSQSRQYPLQTVFCIDTSGSMNAGMETDGLAGIVKTALLGSGDEAPKIDIAKSGLKKAIDSLSAQDSFGVVPFTSSVGTKIGPESGGGVNQAKSAVDDLEATGGTNIRKGLLASRDLLNRMSSKQAIQWIVLISDGQGSIPSDSELQGKFDDRGITIQSAGIGDGYDRDKMLKVSQQTQGELAHIKSAGQLQNFFQEQIQNARNVVALDAELEIVAHDPVSITELYYTFGEQQSTVDPDWNGNRCVIDLGDINHENPPKVKFEMDITATEPDLATELVTATIRTDDGSASDRIEVIADKRRHGLEPVSEEKTEPQPDPDLILQKISTLSQQGDLNEARSVLENNRHVLSQTQYREAEQRLDDFESDSSGESAHRLSTLSSDLDE